MTKAVVIGAGLAGPVAAMALIRAGVDAAVHEAYEQDAVGVGAFLTLSVNGLDALRAIGLDGLVAGLGHPTSRMVMRNHRGRRLAEFPAPGARTVGRSDLYRALRDEALRRGVEFVHGARLVDAEAHENGVTARFADGRSAPGDLLVGADGLRSRVRTLIDPAAPAPRYVPLLNAGGFARGLRLPDERGTMQMMFGRRCFFCWIVVGRDEVWWFANPPQPLELSREQLAAIGPDEARARLRALLDGDPSPARAILDHTTRIEYGWPTYDLPSVPVWHRARMIVLGDAAHTAAPSSGQGAAMAFEDAVQLARCLRDVPDVPAAFAAYERLRRARVERVVAQGRRTSTVKVAGPVGRLARDLGMPLVARLMARDDGAAQSWLFDHHIDWAERVQV
ncbi:NAD(P)/FAD-dependent oxidoreductase [Micromonospora sp. WMMD975]|uniref:FAD-dependent oxidoreductase n=1 Tax=Micromonospora sp. WMMD975 TaxID=3016087 RepID=UPI002499DC90|nr:NAD(P)/FAD-dependent oxidoreductase [Micromonospora sp. WMMD975]WFE31891.1 NAD(P)/FAD-dependent oxidoreductase [Micromonospora sp. WMMD975]